MYNVVDVKVVGCLCPLMLLPFISNINLFAHVSNIPLN